MVNYKYADLFLQDSIDKQVTIKYDGGTITNVELFSESIELSESLCSESALKFGCCEASVLKFKVANVMMPLSGKWLGILETLNHNTDVPLAIGRYKVFSDKPTADRRYRDIVAYDAMYDIINANVADWYNMILPNADSTVTMKVFRTSFIEHFGLEQEDVELINDGMVIEKTIEPSEISGKDVITAICELNGCFGHIGRDGKFKYVLLKKNIHGLYPADDLYPDDDLYPVESEAVRIAKSNYISAHYEDFLTQSIKKLQIRQEENDIGVIVGSEGNCYIVQDNFLIYGKSSEELTGIANNLLSVITGITYRPFDVEAKGNPCLEVGDAVCMSTRYELIESYILKRTLKGMQALRDVYEADGEEFYSEKVNSVHKSIIQLKGKTNTLERSIEETRLTISDLEKGLTSQITQTAQQIRTEVTNTANGLQSQITQNANNINLKVSKNGVISEINQSAESVTIKAAKIDLDGLVTANQFVSKFATIESLNGQKARIDTIEGNYIAAGTVAANYATISSLNSVSARLGTVEANYVSASTVKADYMEVKNWTSGGLIKASKIQTDSLQVGAANVTGSTKVGVVTTVGYTPITYKDGNGNNKSIDVVTSIGTKAIYVLAAD